MGSGLMVRKGDVMVTIDLRTAGLNANAAKKLATKIARRLQ
jgi:multidrug resistance efflux pump